MRVRPNADNFIRDLKAQLLTKRATYWVDVKANMGPANKDVKAWADGDLKTYDPKIPVGANMLQATQDLTKWKNLQRENKTNIPIGIDMTAAQRELTAWRQAAKRDLEIPVKLNVRDLDAALERASKRRVKAEVEVEGDTKPLERKLTGLFLPGGGFREIKVPVDADTTGVKKKLEEVKAEAKADPVELAFKADMAQIDREMKQLQLLAKAKKLGIEVTPDVDPKKLKLQMAKLRLEEARKKISVEVDVKRRNLEALKNLFDRLEGSVGSIATLRSIDLGPITLGKPTGLISTLTTITALAGLLPAIVTGMGALSDVIMRVAGAASILPGAIGGIVASLATLSIGSQGVGDAFSAMFDMWTEGASAQRTAANSLVQSQNSYRNAVVDETKAQRDVGRARRDALGDLRNLNNELRGSVLNEAQAILDAQKARDRYAKGLVEGFDSQTDRMQALLDIAQADQSILDVRERNIGLQNKVNDANKQGVEGSDRVTDALEAQTRAAQATAAAATALADANAGSGTAAEKFADALGLLSPNAREFVLAFAGMKGELFDFRNALQDTLFQGLGPALQQTFRDLLPVIGPGMQQIAAAMNQNILQVFDTLSSPGGQNIIERILGGTAEAQRSLNGLIDPLVRGLGTLMAAGAEHLPQVIDLFTKLADRFSTFIQEADRNGTLDKFMDEGIDALANFAELGINAFKIINDFATAFRSQFGEDLLTMLVRITGEWHKFLSDEKGQAKLVEFIQEAKDLWEDWRPILEDLPDLFSKVSDAAKILIDVITPFLNLFSEAMSKAPGLVEAFILAWGGAKFLGILSTVSGAIASIINGLKALPGLTKNIPTPPVTPGAPGAPVTGPGGIPTASGVAPAVASGGAIAAVAGLALMAQVASNIHATDEEKIQAFEQAHSTAATPEEKAAVTQKYLESTRVLNPGVSRGSFGPGTGIKKGSNLEKSIAEDIKAGTLPGYTVDDDGRISKDGRKLPTYGTGGFTDWGRSQGYPAMLHGKEYIEPADTVAHYGVGAMEAIHEKRVPKGLLQSFQGGGYFDPETGQWVPPQAERAAPDQGNLTGVVNQGVQSAVPVIQNVIQNAGSLQNAVTGVPGLAPGPVIPNAITGIPGPAPGPVDAAGSPTFGVDTSGGQYVPSTDTANAPGFNLFGFNIPMGQQDPTRGWGQGGPPVGLGGGGFDIRNFGIGPGPPGSGPMDWMNFLGSTGGSLLSGFGGALLSGGLDAVGLGGLMNSPLFQAGTGLTEHFLGAPGFGPQNVQAPGNAATNAAVGAHLSTYANMPQNPAYPGYVANMPQTYDANGNLIPGALPPGSPLAPASGEGGLQVNTIATRRGLSAAFPQLTNIGGYRVDPAFPNEHPSGQALDAMVGDNTPLGYSVKDWALQQPNTEYVIWDHKMWYPDGSSKPYTGSSPHTDHPHIHVTGGGYPTGKEQYAVGPAGITPTTVDPSGVVSGTGATQVTGGPAAPSTGLPGVDALTAALGGGGGGSSGGVPSGYSPTPSKTGSSGPGDMTMLAPRRGGPTAIGPQTASPQGFNYADKEGLKKIAHQMYLAAGLPANEWPAFERLIQKESTWDPTAQNPTSTAHGLGQFLDSTSAQFGIPHGTNDPMVQLPAIFAYIKSRYQGSPVRALQFHNAHNWYDQGGWLPPGQTLVNNGTGKPELLMPMDSFQFGGFATGAILPPMPPPPAPRGPDARPITPPRPPTPISPPVRVPPMPAPPAPAAPGPGQAPIPPAPAAPAPVGPGAPLPAPSGPQRPTNQGRVGALVPQAPGPSATREGSHVHPALSKGISSGARAIGQAVSTAIAVAASAAGSSGFAPGAGAAGAIGPYVAGLIEQGGKIVENIANVPSSFLVGNITAGTTENAYGVTQQGSRPSGGTRIIDNSSHIGSIQTANLDEYYRRENLRQSQKAQGALGHWGR